MVQNLFFEPLIIHIAARLRKPLRRSLFRTQEKVVHMEQVAVIDFFQNPSQCALSAAAHAIDRHDHLSVTCCGHGAVDF